MVLRHWDVAACKAAQKEADVMAARGGAGASDNVGKWRRDTLPDSLN